MNAFKTADFYEVLGNTGGRLEREGPFLLEALASAPSRRVADLACGLGLHARFLAEQGALVDAFDLSPEMIEHARTQRAHPNITYAVGDMCAPCSGPYGLAVCLGNSLCLLNSPQDMAHFFAGAYKVLMPGGLLVTQTLNYDAPQMAKPRMRVERAAFAGGELAAVKRFLPGQGRTRLSIDYLLVSGSGMSESAESFVLQHWDITQFSRWARETGFEITGHFGGYDKSDFRSDSPDIVLVMRKSEN